MTTSRRFEDKLYEYYQSIEQYFKGQPITLGGVAGPSGGLGGPPGGFIGYLPQTRVAYDTSEIASSGIPVSGMSLLDNLNHIRWDIQNINPSGSAVDIEDDGSPIASNVTVINFTNELTAVDAGGGQVNVTFSGILDTLDNVDTTGKSDGQVLTWDNDISTWVASGIAAVPSGGVVNLNDLSDVDTTGKSHSDFLTWDNNASLWVASGIPAIEPDRIFYTISGGEITLSGNAMLQSIYIDTEGGASSDDLDQINSGTFPIGGVIWVRLTNSAHNVVFKDDDANLRLNGDFTLDTIHESITLGHVNTNTFMELSRQPITASGGGVTVLDDLNDVNTTGKSDGQVLTWDNDTTTWVASGISQSAPSGPVVIENQLIFTVDSTIDGGTLGVLPLRLYAHDITGTIKEVLCAVNTVPASSGIRVDVMKNGTSILSSPNYVEIPVGSGYADTANIATSGFVKNDYFQIEIVREDSAAADLSVHVRYYWETS